MAPIQRKCAIVATLILAEGTVAIGPLAIFGWFGAVLLAILLIGWALSKIMPPADYPADRPWPTPPRFPPGKIGEFMAEEELRERINSETRHRDEVDAERARLLAEQGIEMRRPTRKP